MLYNFTFTYSDGSYYDGVVSDDGTYGYSKGDYISTQYGSYYFDANMGATSLPVGSVRLNDYHYAYDGTDFTDVYPASDGDQGLGKEKAYIERPTAADPHVFDVQAFGLCGALEAQFPKYGSSPNLAPHAARGPAAAAGGVNLFDFTFTYTDGSHYEGAVADDGSLGYRLGQTIPTPHGSYTITGGGGTGQVSGAVSVTSYYDIATHAAATPDLTLDHQFDGSAGLGSEEDTIPAHGGSQTFGHGGALEANQGLALLDFTFVYADGSRYQGTVVDDGSLGYTVGQTIKTAYGAYTIGPNETTTGLAAGAVSVTSYYDASTDTTLTPDLTGAGKADGAGGLGSEADTVTGVAGRLSFGKGGAQEAAQGIPVYNFTFTYKDGSFHQGTVVDDGARGYAAGQTIIEPGGSYAITSRAGVTGLASGTVSVATYYDTTTGRAFTPDRGADDGSAGLGSETDSVTADGVAHSFGKGGTLEAGTAIAVYAFRFDYPDGSFYQGTVADDGSLGYKAGQTIATAYGAYTITGRDPDTTFRDPGNVTVTRYVDAETGLDFTPDPGSASGAAGLGSETGTITGNQGARSFGQGGALEAPQAADLFDFTFTYADGSAYAGTVTDDGRYGYKANETIATKYGAYSIAGSSAKTASGSGAVSVARYLDAVSGARFIPIATAAGKADGSAGLGSELDMITRPIGTDVFGQGGLYEASGGAPCYCKGTRILAPTGKRRVETLRAGDLVVTHAGHARPVRWVGHRRLEFARHPSPEQARPVRILAHAFADGVPSRDLRLSPDHAVLIDGGLILARQLVNGASVVADTECKTVTYFHVELDTHDVLLAEDLPAESYLDTGNRGMFSNGVGATVLHPGFSDKLDRKAGSCATLLLDSVRAEAAWRKLADRAATMGLTPPACVETTDDPGLHVIADGRMIRPVSKAGGRYVFALPQTKAPVRLVSRAAAPSDARPWIDDRRRLGVMVRRLTLRSGASSEVIGIDDPALRDGWWNAERDVCGLDRWTNGDAALSIKSREPVILEVILGGSTKYPLSSEVFTRGASCELQCARG